MRKLYDYMCNKCERSTELLLDAVDREQPQSCPHCGTIMTPMISAPAMVRGDISRAGHRSTDK